MRHMMREFNRLENQFLGNQEDFPTGLVSLVDQNVITPRIINKEGQSVVEYNFDIKGFRPEDVNIKTGADGRLIVTGKHEDVGEVPRTFFSIFPKN